MESEFFVTADLPEMLEAFQKAEQHIHKQVAWWYRLHIWLQVFFVGLGIIAAIMIAVQNDGNAGLIKPIGLAATILSGGVVTIYNVFHIRETLDELLKIQGDVLFHANELDTLIRRNGIAKSTSDFELIDVEERYAVILNELGRRRRSLMGSVGGILQTKAELQGGFAGSKSPLPVQNS